METGTATLELIVQGKFTQLKKHDQYHIWKTKTPHCGKAIIKIGISDNLACM